MTILICVSCLIFAATIVSAVKTTYDVLVRWPRERLDYRIKRLEEDHDRLRKEIEHLRELNLTRMRVV